MNVFTVFTLGIASQKVRFKGKRPELLTKMFARIKITVIYICANGHDIARKLCTTQLRVNTISDNIIAVSA